MNRIWRIYLAFVEPKGYGEEIIRGVAEYGRQFGPFHFLVYHAGDLLLYTGRELKDVDGIIVYQSSKQPLAHIDWPASVPIISIEPGETTISPWHVVPDDRAVGRLVVEEFLRRGFKRFAYCAFPRPRADRRLRKWDEQRLEGFRTAVLAAGFETFVYQPVGPNWGHFITEWSGPVAAWLRSLPRPIAVMAADDTRARHILLAAEKLEIPVPEQVAVIGVNNEVLAEAVSPAVSSVELDGFRAGYVAMEMLHRRMEGQNVPPGVVRIAPRRLVTRRSSDILAVEDAEVAFAMRFIAQHATSGIGVEQVVQAVSLSRRSLESRFRAALNRSILQEIHAVRIQRAKLLLADPSISLAKVAKTAGFPSAKAMSIAFPRITGVTPSAYRAASRRPDDSN